MPEKGAHEGSKYVFLMSKSRNLYTFVFSNIILGNSATHFLEIIMLIGRHADTNRNRGR